MSKNLFNRISAEALRAGITPRTDQSREWFRKRAQSMRRINREGLMRAESLQLSKTSVVGNMYMFFYDPKHKDTLPYYDRFPLVIMIGPAKGGFYGLNLHYLPPILRARFLDRLLDFTDDNSFDVTYKMLKATASLRYFQPCYKHYLDKHMRSTFGTINPLEWETAAFLPIADFRKSSKREVWKVSRSMV